MIIHTDNIKNLVSETTSAVNRKLGELRGALIEIEKDWTLVDKQIKETAEKLDALKKSRVAIIGSHDDTEKAIKKLEEMLETLPILLEEQTLTSNN